MLQIATDSAAKFGQVLQIAAGSAPKAGQMLQIAADSAPKAQQDWIAVPFGAMLDPPEHAAPGRKFVTLASVVYHIGLGHSGHVPASAC